MLQFSFLLLQTNFDRHVEEHSVKHTCESCGKQFPNKNRLDHHKKHIKRCRSSHHSTTSSNSTISNSGMFECECGQSYASKYKLSSHKNFHCKGKQIESDSIHLSGKNKSTKWNGRTMNMTEQTFSVREEVSYMDALVDMYIYIYMIKFYFKLKSK